MSSLPGNSKLDKPRRVALYGRVSTEDQAERGTIAGQVAFLRDFCRLYSLDVAGEYFDDGISGTVSLADRPEGRRLIEDVQAGRIQEVIVYRLDRLGRTLRALLDAHDNLAGMGVTIRSATEPFDTATPIGTFLFQLLGSLAQLERSTITERMLMGRDRVAKAGKWTGGPIPLGYDLDADGCLIPSLRMVDALGITEADFARLIFTRVAEGGTVQSECLRLNALGVPCFRRFAKGRTSKPGTGTEERPDAETRHATRITRGQDRTEVVFRGVWEPSRIQQMLKNPLYGRGVHELHTGRGQGPIIERPGPALVSPDVWQRANDQLAKNRKLAVRNAQHFYPLRGLIRCGNCGRGYVGSRTAGKETYYYKYRCNGTTEAHLEARDRCQAKSVPSPDLDEAVWADCRQFILEPGDTIARVQEQLRDRLSQSAGQDNRRRALIEQIAMKETERERVMTLFRRGKASLEDTEAQLDQIAKEEGELRGMLAAMRAQEDLAVALETQLTEAAAMLARFHAELDEIERVDDWHRRSEIMNWLVKSITVTTTGEGKDRKVENPLVVYWFSSPEARRIVAVDNTTKTRGRSRGGDRARESRATTSTSSPAASLTCRMAARASALPAPPTSRFPKPRPAARTWPT